MEKDKYHDRGSDFLLQEHALLWADMSSLIAEVALIERLVVGAAGAVWCFLFLHAPIDRDRWLWWVPVLFTVLGAARVWAIRTELVLASDYVRCIEQIFSELGWGHFLAHQTLRLIHPARLLWATLFFCVVAVALYKLHG